ncbi:enoyl-CoA hydratase/isomerase family protein [Rosistilla oblonga]|uniref:Putative enoyl-CoA hydratase echA8 n=1 Tax=Rosistilla oblonga TaxID=2527990 RepID=A0A518IY43_9BACT|nr:enoyl-CoA hydratase-related protein [Rosistilla oblonga]QDV58008.1 putative enoyl-CoA hydratase echA8 [Rosistilla oblonga]
MEEWILVDSIQPGIESIVLNRPGRRNALSIELLDQLSAALKRIESDRGNRVVILRAAGPVFSAGLDLREAADHALVERSAAAVERALRQLRETSLIVIAAVQGGAFAGGAGLMAACDLVIAAEDAKFGFPEARRGLLPALICDVLRHKVREGDLRELFLLGEPVDAARAQQVGLVQRIVAADQLRVAAVAAAEAVIAGGPQTIRQTKRLINETFAVPKTNDAGDSIKKHLAARHSAEAHEGLAAFIEKRDPRWEAT